MPFAASPCHPLVNDSWGVLETDLLAPPALQIPLRFVLQAAASAARSQAAADRGVKKTPGKQDCGSDSEGASEWDVGSSDSEGELGSDSDSDARSKDVDPAEAPVCSTVGSRGRKPSWRCLCRSQLRGLPGRLRFLRDVALLPNSCVFKIFQLVSQPNGHASVAGVAPSTGVASPAALSLAERRRLNWDELAECIRLLLLPWEGFSSLRVAVLSWQPAARRLPQTSAGVGSTIAMSSSGLPVKQRMTSGSRSTVATPASESLMLPEHVLFGGGAACAHTRHDMRNTAVADQGVLGQLVGDAMRAIVRRMLSRYPEQRKVPDMTQVRDIPGRILHGTHQQGYKQQPQQQKDEAGHNGESESTQMPACDWRLGAAQFARLSEQECLLELGAHWGSADNQLRPTGPTNDDRVRLIEACRACWSRPRPGMSALHSKVHQENRGNHMHSPNVPPAHAGDSVQQPKKMKGQSAKHTQQVHAKKIESSLKEQGFAFRFKL
jgi:hypothetical protein